MHPFGVVSVRHERARRAGSGLIVLRLPRVRDDVVESRMNVAGRTRLDGWSGVDAFLADESEAARYVRVGLGGIR